MNCLTFFVILFSILFVFVFRALRSIVRHLIPSWISLTWSQHSITTNNNNNINNKRWRHRFTSSFGSRTRHCRLFVLNSSNFWTSSNKIHWSACCCCCCCLGAAAAPITAAGASGWAAARSTWRDSCVASARAWVGESVATERTIADVTECSYHSA